MALSNASRSAEALLVASGDTRREGAGSPTPGVVVASSGGIDAGGGP